MPVCPPDPYNKAQSNIVKSFSSCTAIQVMCHPLLVTCPHNSTVDWLIEQGLTSHQTHYRSYRGWFIQVIWPNQQRQSTEGNQLVLQIRLADKTLLTYLNPTRTTPPCYNNTTLGNRLYAWCKGPNVINPICWTCKNCSHECAADCEHCVTQPSTEQF